MSKSVEEAWLSIPEKHRMAITNSCWCSKCRTSVEISEYVVKAERGVLVLEGGCQ